MGDILFLAHRLPFPPDRGDKIRAFNVLKHLSARANVHLVAFADDLKDLTQTGFASLTASRSVVWRGKSRLRAAAEAITTGRPVSLTAFADGEIRRAVERVLATKPIETIYVFSSQMAQYVPVEARPRLVMDFCDVDSAKFAAYAQASSGLKSWVLSREARVLAAHDRAVAKAADVSLFVSDAEADLFRAAGGEGAITTIENGIDTRYFDPAAAFTRIEADAPLIVFTGQMDYLPNVEAVTWFAEQVMPIVRTAHPEACFAIVGRAPLPEVRALGTRPGVVVTGEVQDVRGWLAAASVVVAPLQIARGIQNKVLEAMAMARPVVASALAVQGIDHRGTIRVGSDAADYAEAVVTFLDHCDTAEALGTAARVHVQARYGWDACLAPLDRLLGLPSPPSRSAA